MSTSTNPSETLKERYYRLGGARPPYYLMSPQEAADEIRCPVADVMQFIKDRKIGFFGSENDALVSLEEVAFAIYFLRHPKHPISDYTRLDPKSYKPLLYGLRVVKNFDKRQKRARDAEHAAELAKWDAEPGSRR